MNPKAAPTKLNATDLIDIASVRAKLLRAEKDGTRMGEVWTALRRQAKASPRQYAWFVPFVAAVTEDDALHEQAKAIILSYLDAIEQGELGMGVQMHFWCMAFPHARWAIWFDLLRRSPHWTDQEARQTASRFLLIQQRDYYAGLLTKPYPGCCDNQCASLTLSCLVLGTLFADFPVEQSSVALMLRQEGLRRAEAMIGGMPVSGYSGEGSTYQGHVVAPSVPFFVEFLERIHGGDWFNRPMAPNGTTAHDILQMTARLWQPSGLLLPWDDYGYQFGCKMPVAYLARRTGLGQYVNVLEKAANWASNPGAGWGYDEAVWALIYWPQDVQSSQKTWAPWAQQDIGGTLVSPSGDRYLMQMWDDPSDPPFRAQVNPNSLVLEADGVPLTVDGMCAEECQKEHTFNYDDTWRELERHTLSEGVWRVNYGRSTAGGHNAILVDDWQGFRPKTPWQAAHLSQFDPAGGILAGDVTGLYRSRYDDAQAVIRQSRLVDGRFWLVEDWAHFAKPHSFTSRWYFRPDVTAVAGGLDLQTPEGEHLAMRALVGPGAAKVTRIVGFPVVLDGQSDQVDFRCAATAEARWLWLLWPTATRQRHATIDKGWAAWPGPNDAGPDKAAAMGAESFPIEPNGQPWLHADVPMVQSWWYTNQIDVPADKSWWLCLPRGLPAGARLWIDRQEIDLASYWPRANLLSVHVPAPQWAQGKSRLAVTLHISFEVGHYPNEDYPKAEPAGPDGQVSLLVPNPQPVMLSSAAYRDGTVTVVTSDGKTHTARHQLMTPAADASGSRSKK